jgi:uncharacterized membrane protein YedE/YeeE
MSNVTPIASTIGGVLLGLSAAALFVFNGRVASPRPPAFVIVAGLLVGVGVRITNGRTTGHGVCGMSRLSERSIVATMASTPDSRAARSDE